MRKIFPGIIGNSAIKDHIGRDIAAAVNSHAYIIEGADGSGKRSIADKIAAAVSCRNRYSDNHPLPCGECEICKKVSKGISGDVVYINRGDKASIGIDHIRKLKSGLYVTPNDSDMRTYIIEEAEKMTVEAQNSLLLSLEEPPPFVIFLLLTEDATALLETVRSRAQIIRTEVFSSEQVASVLSDIQEVKTLRKRDPQAFDAAVAMSGGSIGKAKDLLVGCSEGKELVKLRGTAAELAPLLCNGKTVKMLDAVTSNSIKNNSDAKEVLLLLDNAIRDLISVKRTENSSLTFYTSRDEALEISATASFAKLFLIHEKICEALRRLDSNVSSKVALTDMVLQISRYRKNKMK